MNQKQKNEFRDKMKNVISFKFLSVEEFSEILEIAEYVSAEDGDMIIEEDKIDPYFYAVLSGNVAVSVQPLEKEVYISTIGAGQIFGEAGIFLKVKRTANVVSKGKSDLVRIHRDDMMRFFKKYPQAGLKILMLIIYSLLYKLRESNQELAYERKADVSQEDIDSFIDEFMNK